MSDERKTTLAIITFNGPDTADQAYDELRHAKDVKIKTAAVVTRKDDGKLKLKHKRRITFWKGVFGGGILGALLAVATGGVAVAAAGAGAIVGGLVGTTRHNQRKHLKEYLDDKLGQGDSGLGIEFKDDTNWTTVEAIVSKYNGDYLKMELTPATKDALDKMASEKDTAQAVTEDVETEDDTQVVEVDESGNSDDADDTNNADDAGDADDAADDGDSNDSDDTGDADKTDDAASS